ncbi:DUF3883 domain-containing protein [Marinobacter salicampi]|uniref:DUF3883 domain-containing protein n=1 Tax=Marinobacter salicampi TaxID=435907 RepID=UPI00140C271E|nr:DUF3883 domain-containing protein [Marinobacter salicampi]
MEDTTKSGERKSSGVTEGDYTANLLGNIRGHLAGLQGYDIMALELIQNADDAKAEAVIFDITDNALVVWNSGAFTYCGEMTPECWMMEDEGYSCDFHRIADVGSGGKLAKSENIGRFGIGFVSAYQITDHPEIYSSGLKLQLIPEKGKFLSTEVTTEEGTKFLLPWATDPNSIARKGIGATAVRSKDIDQLQEEFISVLRKSLLFLRHIRKAEVRRNGRLLLCCELARPDESSLVLTYTPENTTESWHIIRGDAEEAAARLATEYELLKTYDRSSKFAIALKLEPESLQTGLLYAFLPTEQATGLPLHINADFFPEPDRKSLIFSGNQHYRYWNEMLIEAAAGALAKDPEALGQLIGEEKLWRIVHQAAEMGHSGSDHPACFDHFWERLKASVSQSQVAIDTNGQLRIPHQVYLPKGATPSESQVSALNFLGINLIAPCLSPYRNTLGKVGAPILSLDRLVGLLSNSLEIVTDGASKTEEKMLQEFWVPLWDILEELLPEPVKSSRPYFGNKVLNQLKSLKCLVTEGLSIVSLAEAYQSPRSIDAIRPTTLFPKLAIASSKIARYPKLSRLIDRLELESISNHLGSQVSLHRGEDVLNTEPVALRDFYTFLADLDEVRPSSDKVYAVLRKLPLWYSSQGLIQASKALLPGDFKDPTGSGALLDISILSPSARQFVSEKLGVETQTINSFVETVLPSFFGPSGPLDEGRYDVLIRELSNHPGLLNDPSTLKTLRSLPILPTQDGGWAMPGSVYERKDQLEEVLGRAEHLWLDFSKLPAAQSVRVFVDALGVLHDPAPMHIVDRLRSLSETYVPNEDVKKLSSEAFYTLGEIAVKQVDRESLSTALSELRGVRCLPAKGDEENWYYPSELYAPFRSEGFESQANILDYRNTARLSTSLLDDLGIKQRPPTDLVISHLHHCIDKGIAPHETTYRILSERAKDDPEVSKLKGTRCIYVEQLKDFVKPTKVYWSQQQLGRFAYRVPPKLESFTNFFEVIGVKDSPGSNDLVEIVLEIIDEFYQRSKPLVGADRRVYELCMGGIAEALSDGAVEEESLVTLREAPSILNLEDRFAYPDEILLHDSEWLSKFFDEELNCALCKLDPELWGLAQMLRVEALSKACSLRLDQIAGETSLEEEVSGTLNQRARTIRRLLHDKPKGVQERVTAAFSNLRVYSVDNIHVQALAVIDQREIQAPVCSAEAFFDYTKSELLVTRPLGEASWAPVLTSLLHHLMPDEPGTDVTKLTLMFHSLLKMSPEDADAHLTSFGVPELVTDDEFESYDLGTQQLDELGHAGNENEQTEDLPKGTVDQEGDADAPNSDEAAEGKLDDVSIKPTAPLKAKGANENDKDVEEDETDDLSGTVSGGFGKNDGVKAKRHKRRPKFKEQWDKRLLSYVRMKDPQEEGSSEDSGDREHNLAVEAAARQAVCEYEENRGRIPDQMPQTHPGHDIESIEPETGESRLIEVKGVNGEWNQAGVGLSRLQFNNAQKYGDGYWLYVVEFVSDPDNIRVHPIQNPASQVTSFMFDGNWREATVDEVEDPSAGFVVGARIKHSTMGVGEITEVKKRGKVRSLTVHFEGKPQPTRNVLANIHQMQILEAEDGNDDS